MKNLKNIVTILSLTIAFGLNAQEISSKEKHWDGLSVYIPQYTKHFEGNKNYNVNGIFNSEGGNLGLVLSYSIKKMHYSLGYIKNSYGDWSKYATIGISIFQTENNQLTFNVGIADKYEVAYSEEKNKEILEKCLPEEITKNFLMPVASLTYKRVLFNVGETNVGLQVNIAPVFINTGIVINFN